jgi:hypothetical protein
MASSQAAYRAEDGTTARHRAAGWSLFTTLLWAQGLYYFGTGLWPIFSIESFQAVTGPKTDHFLTGRESDHWLVMTVAVLIVAIAVTLLCAAWRRSPQPEVVVLAVASALALTVIDVVYVVRGVIALIYLADAAAEVLLMMAWALALTRTRTPAGVIEVSRPSRFTT